MKTPSSHTSVAIVGGGISGLAAAYRLRELDPAIRVSLFEKSSHLGGVARTESIGDYLVEHGPDMFTTKEPWALNLCRRIGFESELISTNAEHAKAFILFQGALHPVPDGFALMLPSQWRPLATSRLLSWRGKLRVACELFVRQREDGADESLTEFAQRRFGREAFERLIQPLISGIYTADPSKLSMHAALAQFVKMEQTHGSMLRAAFRERKSGGKIAAQESGARYSTFVAPRRGMQSLADAIASCIPPSSLRIQTAVRQVALQANKTWQIEFENERPAESFDAVIVATPGHVAAELLRDSLPSLARSMNEIEYASSSVVILGVPTSQIGKPLRGFGVVVPHIEPCEALAFSMASMKFAGRAPDGHTLIRVFLGGAMRPDMIDLTDDALVEIAWRETSRLFQIQGQPEIRRVVRWPRGMPQYHVGHLTIVERIEGMAAETPHFALAGNSFRGVGIPYCVRSGEDAATRIASILKSR